MIKVALLVALLMGAAKCAKSEEIQPQEREIPNEILEMFFQYCVGQHPGDSALEGLMVETCMFHLQRGYELQIIRLVDASSRYSG